MKTFKIICMVLLSAAVMTTGCGKKSSNRMNSNPYAYGYGVPTSSYGQFKMSALGGVYGTSLSSPKMELGLEFYGAATTATAQQPGYGYGGGDPYAEYSGPISAQGTLYVWTVDPYSCPIPAGQYVVTTASAGTMNVDSIYNLTLTAVGPTTLTISLPSDFVVSRNQAQVGSDNKTYPYRLQNYMVIQSPYGGNCSYILE